MNCGARADRGPYRPEPAQSKNGADRGYHSKSGLVRAFSWRSALGIVPIVQYTQDIAGGMNHVD